MGNAKTCRLSGLYTGTRGSRGTSTRGEQQGAGWALARDWEMGDWETGHPDHGNGWPGKPSAAELQGAFLHSIWASCFEAVACLVSERSHCRHPTLLPPHPPAPALSSYHRPPSPHHRAPSRLPGCTRLHLGCQGSPSQGPLLCCAALCGAVLCCSQLRHQGCARARHS